jgi:peptide/nickel transport system substrate-binding protein
MRTSAEGSGRRSAGAGRALLPAPLAVFALAACAAADPGSAGGRLLHPLRTEPATLNFVTAADFSSVLVSRLVGDSLVDYDSRLKPVPRLARDWTFSSDGLTLTFRLRPEARFHDGAPVTSADVLFTYERVIDPENRATAWLDPLLPVARVETPDPHTVRVRYRRPYAPALDGWNVPILPRHLYAGGDFQRSPLNRAPVGSGPFRFASWQAGRRIILRANPDWWGGRPALDSLVLEIIPSQETAWRSLLAGEIDSTPVTPQQREARAAHTSFERRFRIVRFEPLFLYYIAWRADGSNPFFTDPAVRRALSLALDREAYVRSVLRGGGRAVSSLFHPAVGGADPGLPPIPYDPEAAAALLDEAGWRADRSGGPRRRNGVPFRFTLLIYGAAEDQALFSQVAQESLRAIGVEMAIQKLDWPALHERLRSGRFEAAFSGLVPRPDPDYVYALLHSSQIGGGQNYAGFRDPDIDALLEAGRSTLDAERRAGLYRRVDRRLRDLQPYATLFIPIQEVAVARRVRNIEASPRGLLDHFPGAARVAVDAGADG